METDPGASDGQMHRKAGVRALSRLLPLTLIFVAALLLLSALLSWGAATVDGSPPWILPAIALAVGLGSLWTGGYAVRHTRRATRGDFQVSVPQAITGALMLIAGMAMLFTLLLKLPGGSSYRSAFDEDGDLSVNLARLVILSLIMGAFHVGWLWVGAYFYSHAFSSRESNQATLGRQGEGDRFDAPLPDQQ